MGTDLTLLSKKPIWNWGDLDALLFIHALEKSPRDFLGGSHDKQFKKLQKTQRDFGDLIFSAMDSGELEAIHWGRDPIKGVPGLEIKKGFICSWLVEKGVLGWLEEREIDVHKDAIQFIKEEAEKKAIADALSTAKTKPVQPGPKKKSKRHEDSDKQKKAAREVAKQLWEEDETLTIADVINSDPINEVAPNRAERTLRNWIKDLAPSNEPGRRPKKN